MADRTQDQVLDEAVYAMACVSEHYGPGLSKIGLQEMRKLLKSFNFHTDACFRIDVSEDDEHVDFRLRIIWPHGWDILDYNNVIEESKSDKN